MANLEQIMAETSKSYDNSRNALQSQIDAIAGNLDAQRSRINAEYAQQSKNLDNQRNWQAQASSMAASKNGGSFGGTSEIANKRYYEQAFVPAATQLNTNRSNDLSRAESTANDTRLNLQQTLAQMNDEANRYALQRYDAEVAAEREAQRQAEALAEQRRQFDAQQALKQQELNLRLKEINNANAYQQYLSQPQSVSTNPYAWEQNASGGSRFYNTGTGKNVTFGTYASGAGATNNQQLLAIARQALNDAEYARLANIVAAQGNTSHSALKTTPKANYQYANYLSAGDNDFMRNLGLTF